MDGVHPVLASSLTNVVIDEGRKKAMGRRGEKGKNRQGQKQLDESVLIAAFWPEEDPSLKTGETDVKKNPPCDSFFSLS